MRMVPFLQRIFSKKQKNDEIYRLLEGNAPGASRNAVLYIGNGADRVETSEKVYCHLGGRHDICVTTFFESGCGLDVKNVVFSNPDGRFQGYVLRRKHSGVWEWYGCDEAWHTLSADMPAMKLFEPGDALPGADEKTSKTYILEARWVAEDGTYAGCGYPMFQNKLMAHAFGGLDGKTYHNTLRAFEAAQKQNYQYFEVDISLTADNRLVLCHGWTKSNCKTTGMEYSAELEHATYDRVMAKTVHGNPLMDAKDFYKLVKQNPQYRFQVDFHNRNGAEMKKRIELLLKDMKNDAEVMDRLLIQSYNRDMFEGVEKLYPFKYHQYLVGKNIARLDEFINYALDHGICALALRMNHAKPELVQKIKNAGLYTLAYTVNSDIDIASRLLATGVDTLCTDFITPAMLEKPVDSLGQYPFYVYYHAGVPEAESDYPDAKRLKSGNYEYQDMEIWENDGRRSLKKCQYRVEGKKFAGWNLRINVEDTVFWYGEDHLYHSKNDSNQPVKREIFCDEQQLPVLTVKKNMRLVMVAKWVRLLAIICFIGLATFGVRDRACAMTVDAGEAEQAETTPLYYLTKGTSESLTLQIPPQTEETAGEDGVVGNQPVNPEITKIANSKPGVASYEDGTVTGLEEGTTTIKVTYQYAFSSGTVKKTLSFQIRVVTYSRSGNTLIFDADQIEDGDISYSLVSAANEARDLATEEEPYVIRIPAGNYTLSKLVHLYSNVTVEMDAATVITTTRKDTTDENGVTTVGGNMFFLGTVSGTYHGQENYNVSEACAGYGGFENVTIRGGTLVGNSKNTSCLIRMAHATNVTFDGVTFSGGGGKHQIEFAAIDGLTVKNCVFTDTYGPSGNLRITSEALQLDIPTSETNYPGAYQDGTPMKNVEITGCTFKNLSKGIGTHSMLVGAYHTNIKINNNVFSNITYGAITCLNYYNCEIKDNVMENCGAGIDFSYSLPPYLSASNCVYTTIFEGKTAYTKNLRHNARTVISGNKMTIRYHTASVGCVGISVYGYNRTAAVTGSDGKAVTAQDYYVSGVTVTGNEIVTAGYGIRLSDAKKCTITNNTVKGKDFSEDDAHIKNGLTYDGIYLTEKSSTLELSGNSISKMNGGGIYLSNSTAHGGICNNTISGVKRYGIYLYYGSRAKVGITGNNIKSTSEAEALIYLNTTATTRHIISGNTLKGYKTNAAIKVDSGKFTIVENDISRVSDGVVLADEATGYIYANTCSSKAASRVRFADKNYYMVGILQTSVKASRKGVIKPELPATKNIGGYEIQVSTSKSFRKDVLVYRLKATDTSPVISGLTAKKKYYVRAYAYKTHKGVRIYKNE